MKTGIIAIITTVVIISVVTLAVAAEMADIDKHRECIHCGMDRKAYGYSRMFVEYNDGKKVGTCSLHCVITELNNKTGDDITFKVADRNSKKLIDATKAFWVIGGKKMGVMTARAKWAFETKNAAVTFMQNYGGSPATWNEALAAAQEDAVTKPKR